MNNLRHGWGSTYDRNGIQLYEGDWGCGNIGNDCLSQNTITNDENIHNLLSTLVVASHCLNEDHIKKVHVHDYVNLRYMEIGSYCGKYVKEMIVTNCPNLEGIRIEKMSCLIGCEVDEGVFHVSHCEKLKRLEIGKQSFCNYLKAFEVQGKGLNELS